MTSSTPKKYDLVIVGGGSAGLTAAGFARRLGVSVAILDKERIGGELRLLEFVHSENRLTAFWQDLLTPLTHAIYGARLNRDLTTLIRQSGYEIVSAEAMGGGSVMLYHAVVPASKKASPARPV